VPEPSRAAGCAITASIGGCLGRGAITADALFAAADAEMYRVKHSGKNGVAWIELTPAETGRRQERDAEPLPRPRVPPESQARHHV
jgi:predicted signal transduction protein with EAL and GGDEF domain